MLIHKIIKGLYPNYLARKIEIVQKESTIQTRQEEKLYIDRYKTREEQKMLLRDGFETYNNL